jgi:probable rRNA maturation factor
LNTIEIAITIDLPSTADSDWDAELESSIENAVNTAAAARGFSGGRIGVMITDDDTIHAINRRHLDHDYPTDVISFTYDRSNTMVEGELVVSLCTARRLAQELGWDWRCELLLYVVHGTLHICGLEDSTPTQRAEMRTQEQAVLASMGIADARQFSPDSDSVWEHARRDEAFSAEQS